MNKKIFVIVVTFNGMPWITKCFNSLINSSIPLQILVVDNASDDETCQYIKQNFLNIELIETGSNLGFGKANNIGLKKALEKKADYVFLLNQDAWVEQYCVEKLIHYSESNLNFSLLSPYHLNYDGKGTEFYFEQYILQYYTKNYNNPPVAAYETSFVHAAAWLLPKDTIRKVGGFDPLFKHTGEDNDYVQRLQFKKLKAGILTDAYVYHKGTNAGLINPRENFIQFLNADLLRLKNPNATLVGAFWLLYRKTFPSFMGYIFSRKIVYEFSYYIFLFVLKNNFQIISSRQQQTKENAYL
ncbi:MAG: glycosyltransferase family 2 protein [Chitinophagaceae bacterium]|nr:glycosyltransferase family 2 protein [Chitinophagaceae bacterium]